ncbi:CoA transferase [SAR202 cluster bacterium AD-804-J14_MRT_500m]|nr:CoA transferase [SAR202 cluster bacterium AD-804-J14_MRT_500m]
MRCDLTSCSTSNGPNLPLNGIRVTDFTWVHAGPSATRILADQGAQVIKIESSQALSIAGGPIPRTALGVGQRHNWNAGKLSVTLNMRNPYGVELAERLIQISDVVAENFSSRVMPSWGLDYHNLRKLKPDIIMLSMSAMGRTGPWKEYVSYGQTLQAWSGFTELTGFPETDPCGPASAYSDASGGMAGAQGVLLALIYRSRTGQGQMIDLSQFETMTSLLGPTLLELAVNKNSNAVGRLGNRLPHAKIAPHGAYKCQDEDSWIAITVFTEAEWIALKTEIGNPSWSKDQRFSTANSRLEHADELDRFIESWTSQYSAEYVMNRLQKAGIPAGVIQTGQDLVENDPHLRDRGFYKVVQGSVPIWYINPHANNIDAATDTRVSEGKSTGQMASSVTVEGPPYILSGSNGGPSRGGPVLGQDQNFIVKELLGLSDDEIAEYAINEAFE